MSEPSPTGTGARGDQVERSHCSIRDSFAAGRPVPYQGVSAERARPAPAREGVLLHEFLTLHRDEIIARTRGKVAARSAPRATPAELENGVILFLEQLAETLRCEQVIATRGTSDEISRVSVG